MRRRLPALLFAALALSSLSALPSAAQPGGAGAETEEKRTRLFKEGKAAADAGQWAEAAEKFRKVVAIRSAPKALIALGVAEEHLGHLVAALAAYKQAREDAADKALADELRTVSAALDALRPRVPKLSFSPADVAATARIEIDGEAVKLTDGALPVDPGEHRVSASSPGKGTFQDTVTLKEGEQRTIEIVLSSAVPTATVEPTGQPDTGSARPPTGAVVTGALGLAVIGGGAALFGVGSGQYSQNAKLCPGVSCTSDVAGRGNGGRTQMILGDALIGVGAAAVAGAGVWWIVSAVSSKKKGPGTSVFVAPRVGGLDIGGRF
jgi:hypothetical protein